MSLGIRKSYLAAIHDLLMAALSVVISLYLRLGDNFEYAEPSLIPATIIFTAICAVVFYYNKLYRGVWRYASMHDLINLTKSVTIAIIILLPAMFIFNRLDGMPRSFFIINWFVLMALLGGPRFIFRSITRRNIFPDFTKVELGKKIRVLVVGVNDHTEMFLRDVVGSKDSQYEVVAIVDDDKNKAGSYMYNVPIYPDTNSIVKVVEKLKKKDMAPQKILFSPGFVESEKVKELLSKSEELGLTIARIPRLTEFKAHQEESREIQPIVVEDLLGRPQTALDRKGIKEFIKNKRILVTGAGGTIGSELVRQIASYSPDQIVLLENSEHSLYLIDKELEETFPKIKREAVIGDVRNRKKLDATFKKHNPEIVFHAAALKHVPLSELNIDEAALTNIVGTKNVADACIDAGVKEMVMISTDKAVNPTNIMGATKRAAECYIQSLGVSKQAKDTLFITVRFGNVLGSTGSVVPLFRRQLQQGGPLTVTDPKITRYFMTVREAVELVLQASVIGAEDKSQGAIYVLDMGEPVKIKDLATQMIKLAGLKIDEDIKIEYTGLRPGEKMYEELFYEEEEPQKTKHSSIMLAKPINSRNLKTFNKDIEKLYNYSIERNTKKSKEIISALVIEYHN